jgi:nitroreductase
LPHDNSEINFCAGLFYYCSTIAQRSVLGHDVMLCLLTLADGLDSASYGPIYPSVQNLLLAARASGLGAALITLRRWSTWLVRRPLRLPWRVTPCAVVPLGWPIGRYGPTTRRPVGEVVHLDRYGHQPFKIL